MSRRSPISKAVSPLALATLALAAPLYAESPAPADAGMAQFQFSGMVNADNVYVRSGGSESDYPVVKLNKGDSVVVVGASGDWLKILPPEGVFCLVGQMWVDARGDGTVGRVRDGSHDVNVRVGSNLNNMIARIVVTVDGGTDVKILGKQDEYYKIAPPAGAYVYVNKRFVDVVKRVTVTFNNGQAEVKPAEENAPPSPAPTPAPQPKGEEVASNTNTNNATPTPAPAPAPSGGTENAAPAPTPNPATEPVAAKPTTMPAAEAQAAFDALEQRFVAASAKPIDQQPLAELMAGYKMLADDKTLPESISKTADSRVKSLKVRQELYADFQKHQADQQAAAAKEMPAVAEAKEIEQRIKDTESKRYNAVGTLHTSALSYNGQTLYRLTDPSTGRTVIYIVTTDPTVKALEGQFIGVKGDATDDTVRRIKYIAPTAAEVVDPADLARGTVTSGLVPPSLTATASGVGQ